MGPQRATSASDFGGSACIVPRDPWAAEHRTMERSLREDTVLGHAGNRPGENHGVVNPPVYHASTILFPTVAAMEQSLGDAFAPRRMLYGRAGTPTSFALEAAVEIGRAHV